LATGRTTGEGREATGKVIYDEFYPKHSKPIIDEIDRVLAGHYGFTDEELDFPPTAGRHRELRHQVSDGARGQRG